MLNILALASVILRPIFSLYPNVNFPLQTLLHRVVMPKLSQAKGNDSGSQINKLTFDGQELELFTVALDPVLSQIILYH